MREGKVKTISFINDDDLKNQWLSSLLESGGFMKKYVIIFLGIVLALYFFGWLYSAIQFIMTVLFTCVAVYFIVTMFNVSRGGNVRA